MFHRRFHRLLVATFFCSTVAGGGNASTPHPTAAPTTASPTHAPTAPGPTTAAPTPGNVSSLHPTAAPITALPTHAPTAGPTTAAPTSAPSAAPTSVPSAAPSASPLPPLPLPAQGETGIWLTSFTDTACSSPYAQSLVPIDLCVKTVGGGGMRKLCAVGGGAVETLVYHDALCAGSGRKAPVDGLELLAVCTDKHPQEPSDQSRTELRGDCANAVPATFYRLELFHRLRTEPLECLESSDNNPEIEAAVKLPNFLDRENFYVPNVCVGQSARWGNATLRSAMLTEKSDGVLRIEVFADARCSGMRSVATLESTAAVAQGGAPWGQCAYTFLQTGLPLPIAAAFDAMVTRLPSSGTAQPAANTKGGTVPVGVVVALTLVGVVCGCCCVAFVLAAAVLASSSSKWTKRTLRDRRSSYLSSIYFEDDPQLVGVSFAELNSGGSGDGGSSRDGSSKSDGAYSNYFESGSGSGGGGGAYDYEAMDDEDALLAVAVSSSSSVNFSGNGSSSALSRNSSHLAVVREEVAVTGVAQEAGDDLNVAIAALLNKEQRNGGTITVTQGAADRAASDSDEIEEEPLSPPSTSNGVLRVPVRKISKLRPPKQRTLVLDGDCISTENRRGQTTNRWRFARNFVWAHVKKKSPKQLELCVVHSSLRKLDPLRLRERKLGAAAAAAAADDDDDDDEKYDSNPKRIASVREVLRFELVSSEASAALAAELNRRADHFGRAP